MAPYILGPHALGAGAQFYYSTGPVGPLAILYHGAYGPLNSTHNASHYAFSYSSAARCYNVTKPRATAQLFFTMITSIRATIMTPADLSIVHRAPSPWGAGPCD